MSKCLRFVRWKKMLWWYESRIRTTHLCFESKNLKKVELPLFQFEVCSVVETCYEWVIKLLFWSSSQDFICPCLNSKRAVGLPLPNESNKSFIDLPISTEGTFCNNHQREEIRENASIIHTHTINCEHALANFLNETLVPIEVTWRRVNSTNLRSHVL